MITSHYYKYDPFVLAKQVLQVYFAPYPSLKKIKQTGGLFLKQRQDLHLMEIIFQMKQRIKQILSQIPK